jgi:hypothetical protein
VKFAIRQPANFLYPSITSAWEARLTPEDSLRFARKVDELRFDQLWVSEHMIQLPEMLGAMGPWFYEAVSAAAVLLGATKRVERVKKAGATGAIVHLPPGTSGLGECIEWVEWFSQEIIPQFED